jgi:hypothetical protein
MAWTSVAIVEAVILSLDRRPFEDAYCVLEGDLLPLDIDRIRVPGPHRLYWERAERYIVGK